MQETGRQQQERHRSCLEHESVDPAVRGRAQAADQEEQEEGADEVKDLRGALLGLPAQHEEGDAEEGEAEQAGEEVGRAADEPPSELDSAHLLETLPAAQQVGHLVADLVARQNPAGLRARGEEGAVDADDPVSRQDPCEVGARAGHHLADRERAPLVGFEDDAVVGSRHEDVDDRQQGEGKRPGAEQRDHPRQCPPPHFRQPSGLLYVQTASRIWRPPAA